VDGEGAQGRLQISTIAAAACCICFAQDLPVIRLQVRVVTVPTVVTSRSGKYVRDLGPDDFELFDNERDQKLHLDYAAGLLSLAIVVQTNDAVRAWLPEVRGPLRALLKRRYWARPERHR
jgi:hypothetical protein